jgi:SAM-dependent methyltransferase
MSSAHFDAYAAYYDLLYRDKPYAEEAQFVAGLLRRHAPEAQSLVDIGCGTGAHDRHLAAAGYAVHGVDLSEAMLGRARAAALGAGLADRLTYSQGDARSFTTPGPADAAVALFDVASYVTSDTDFASFLGAVRRAIRPGGLFIFDFWYGPAVYGQQPHTRVRRIEDDAVKVARIAEPVFHHERNVVDVNYDVFVTEKANGRIANFQEKHPMRCFFDAELEALMQLGGFSPIFRTTWMDGGAPSPSTWSILTGWRAA